MSFDVNLNFGGSDRVSRTLFSSEKKPGQVLITKIFTKRENSPRVGKLLRKL